MQIQIVRNAGLLYEVTLADGVLLWVPFDAQNTDYARVQAWAAAGGVITS